MEIEQEELNQEQNIPLLCEIDRKSQAFPKNLGPCITQGCTKPTKYACPKCKCNYCSLDCYKNHNETCVNKFYEENVIEELKNRKADEQTQKKMNKLLKEYKEQLDQDREEFEIPEKELERLEELEDLMMQNELDLDCLTIEEQRQFADFIKNNEQLQKYIKPWKPWWLLEDGLFSLYVEEIETDKTEQKKNKDSQIQEVVDFRSQMKQRIKKQISFKILCKIPPHIDIPNQLANIICGAALTLRMFNGDIWENPLESLNFLVSVSISSSPQNRVEIGSIQNAMNSVITNALRIESQNIKNFIPLLQEDMQTIFKNKIFILEILYRLFDLLHEGQIELRDMIEESNEGPIKNQQKENQKELGNIKQKIIFFISYTKDIVTPDQLQTLLRGIVEFKQEKELNAQIDNKIGQIKKLSLLL
ncbi:hypothetical protein ABPG72_005649 [Tetrahymena utriculariae]